MGRQRQKYNWKARQNSNTKVDETEQKKIKLENLQYKEDKFDESNALVLPSKKRKTKRLKDKKAPPVKLLSKKQRKKLEKIVDLKRKKSERSELLEALEKVKADPSDLSQLTQLQSTQTLGRKRFLASDYTDVALNVDGISTNVSAVKGNKRRKGLPSEPVERNQNCNVVQLGELSSDTDSETEDSDDSISGVDDKIVAEDDNRNDNNDTLIHSNSHEVKTVINEDNTKLNEENVNEEIKIISDTSTIPTPIKSTFISVSRSSEIQTARSKLPILSEEQGIMEAIKENRVTVIVGTTGSGKTTQVPQFLYEAGYACNGKIIGVTEPRRIAAIAMSQRVGQEMNLSSEEVSYQIRFESNATPKTKIKFMTDGVLLKEIQADPMLKKYSVVIVDEAHERSVFSDILIGILSRIIPRRESKGNPLKLVIMSATLRIEDFTENKRLFKDFTPPVMKVDARMFDVTVHYNKKTEDDYVAEAYKKVCKIHRQLPEGGILVFLTGQQEVNQLCRKLCRTFPFQKRNLGKINHFDHALRKKKKKLPHPEKTKEKFEDRKIVLPNVNLDEFVSVLPDDTEGDEGVADIEEGKNPDVIEDRSSSDEEVEAEHCEEQPLWVLPLYSMLPPEKQQQVFKQNPPGTRLCVVATNVAETSLTIPNMKYVVDSGKVKEKVYDQVTGVSIFHITWTSQASANQRAGRAGRTSAGHCYRLYSSAVFNEEFNKFSTAEIQRRPIDDLVLVMKSMNLPIVNFPFPTPPDSIQVQHSLRRLKILGALKDGKKGKYHPKGKNMGQIADATQVTELGKAMSAFPLSPRFGKMLALSYQHGLLPYTVAIVSALTVQEVLVEIPLSKEENATKNSWQKLRTSWAGLGNCKKLGDIMVLLCAVGAAEYQGGTRSWCEQNGLRYKAICEIRKLRRQLTNEINLVLPGCNLVLDPQLKPPSNTQARLLCQIMLAGLVDHVARRVDDWEVKDPQDKAKWKNAYRTLEMEDPVFLHNSTVLKSDRPQWLVYQEIHETTKMFIRGATVIEPEWLATFAPHMCVFSAPLEKPAPIYDGLTDTIYCYCTATFGPSAWEIPVVKVPFSHGRDLFKWAAYFFLIGELCPTLKQYKEHIYDPKTLVSLVAIRYREQRENLILALVCRDICNQKHLYKVWEDEPKYLLKEYIAWIENASIKEQVKEHWPPILK